MISHTAALPQTPISASRLARPDIAYQPFLELRSLELVGAEALARFGSLDTGPCVRLIERLGSAAALDTAMIDGVLTALEHDPGWLPVHVNVSAQSLSAPGFVRALHHRLLACPEAAARLVLEVTETAPLPSARVVLRFAHTVRDAGVRLSVDDVPAGYDRHVAIGLLQPDVVKLDGPTLRRAMRDAGERTRIAAVTTIARDIGAITIAEGIEEPAHVEAALQFGAEIGQGYRLGPPVRRPLGEVLPCAAH